ncbi:MAG: hypothetical protein JWM41_285 [Gemmatimonadetes bacterium]|nr:hypothetical protein [Gemmatimonadota bacterium]
MALRTFVDAIGDEWQVFDVVPRATERRSQERRSLSKSEELAAERRDRDRRLTVGGRSGLSPSVAQGWLTFERGLDRRRLSPIPAGWQRASDAELEEYCRAARAVRRDSVGIPQADNSKR